MPSRSSQRGIDGGRLSAHEVVFLHAMLCFEMAHQWLHGRSASALFPLLVLLIGGIPFPWFAWHRYFGLVHRTFSASASIIHQFVGSETDDGFLWFPQGLDGLAVMRVALKSTDGRDDPGWASRGPPSHLIAQFIYLMNLVFSQTSRQRLVNGIDFVVIESLLIDHSLVPFERFLVWAPLLRGSFSCSFPHWSAGEGLEFRRGLFSFFGSSRRLLMKGWTHPFFDKPRASSVAMRFFSSYSISIQLMLLQIK